LGPARRRNGRGAAETTSVRIQRASRRAGAAHDRRGTRTRRAPTRPRFRKVWVAPAGPTA